MPDFPLPLGSRNVRGIGYDLLVYVIYMYHMVIERKVITAISKSVFRFSDVQVFNDAASNSAHRPVAK
jgi:hypothetical protein